MKQFSTQQILPLYSSLFCVAFNLTEVIISFILPIEMQFTNNRIYIYKASIFSLSFLLNLSVVNLLGLLQSVWIISGLLLISSSAFSYSVLELLYLIPWVIGSCIGYKWHIELYSIEPLACLSFTDLMLSSGAYNQLHYFTHNPKGSWCNESFN